MIRHHEPEPGTAWIQIISTFLAAVSVTLAIVGAFAKLTLDPIGTFENDTKEHLKDIDVRMAPLLTLSAQIKSDDATFDRLQKEIDARLTWTVHNSFAESIGKSTEENRSATLRTLEVMQIQIRELEGKIVSRSENTEHWISIDAHILALENRLNALSPLGASKPVVTPTMDPRN